jgi:hypothetical protein
MQGLKTISFFEGENSMTGYVAYQEDTGTVSGYPFLHRVPAIAISFTKGKLPVGVHQNQPISAKDRSV